MRSSAERRSGSNQGVVWLQNETAPGAPYAPFVEGGLAYVDAAFQWGTRHNRCTLTMPYPVA